MRGNMKVWIVVVWIVAATWIWWNVPGLLCLVALIVVPTWIWWNAAPLRGVERVKPRKKICFDQTGPRSRPPRRRYHTVTFSTENATKTSYTKFIGALRKLLASEEERHGIPVMRDPSKVPDEERFILVELSNSAVDSITLAVDVTNAYVVAYQAGGRSFFLSDKDPNPPNVKPFPITERKKFPFSGGYKGLEKDADKTRAGIALGMWELGDAIKKLSISDLKQRESLAHSLIVVIQMVAEAVRFKHIEKQVCDSFGIYSNPTKLDPKILEDENKWGGKSKAIHQSDVGGVISSQVAIMPFGRRTEKRKKKGDQTTRRGGSYQREEKGKKERAGIHQTS